VSSLYCAYSPYGYEHNAATQRRHPESLLNWTQRIIRIRKEVPEVGWGDFAVTPSGDRSVLIMRYDWRNNWVLCNGSGCLDSFRGGIS
jgi:maltose alpha-D-glucosyltransferase/alpha-amylase